jgi:hypothetical protein
VSIRKPRERVEWLPHESDAAKLSVEAWNMDAGAPFDPKQVAAIMRRCFHRLRDLERITHAVSVLSDVAGREEASGKRGLGAGAHQAPGVVRARKRAGHGVGAGSAGVRA